MTINQIKSNQIQIGAKLGGEPWIVHIPLKNTMVIGFDIHHCGKRKGSSIGAMVATTSARFSKYFSTISFLGSKDEFSDRMGSDFTKCLQAYYKINEQYPERIIIYRDGVGNGQLQVVVDTELQEIQKNINTLYQDPEKRPKLTFIVVTKGINTRIFGLENNGRREVNPEPGTVVDDFITLPERYDFYLVSQTSKQGTVSPVSYNIIYDRSGLEPDKIQKLTYKLCHMYFNWSGTVTVPAPCQYARKLAYLTGLALGAPCHGKLSNSLYFL